MMGRISGGAMTERTLEYPDQGPWQLIERNEHGVTYHPRQPGRLPRFEFRLPSGGFLVHDLPSGFVLRKEYYRDADLDALQPKGRPLRDRAVLKLQDEEALWYVFHYQDVYTPEDVLLSSDLRLIECRKGHDRIDHREIPTGQEAR
jgi:hypothetical protein